MSSLRARLSSHAAIPLYRSAYALMGNVAINSALGFLFWAVASRTYSAKIVGINSAGIAALTFLTGIGGLFLDGSLYRFLPRAGDATHALVGVTAAVTAASATVAALVFVAGVHVWAPDLAFLTSSPAVLLAAVLAVVGSCLLVLVDGAFIGVRRAGWVPIKGSVYGLAKIAVLVICVSLVPRYGILVAWVAPSAVVLAASAWLLRRRLLPAHRAASRADAEQLTTRAVSRYAGGNYLAFLSNLAYRTLPPLLVIHELGAKSSAYFYVPWLISTSLVLLTNNISVSLVVEGSLDRQTLALQTRRALRQFLRLVLPISVVLMIGAQWVLRIFGAGYAAHGASTLRLLALGLIPASVAIIAVGVARVQDHVAVIISTQFCLAVVVLGLGAVLLPSIGLAGFGVSWVAAQTVAAVWLARRELRPLLKPPRPEAAGQEIRLEELEGEMNRMRLELSDAMSRLDSQGRTT